jgi:hypothetical protein
MRLHCRVPVRWPMALCQFLAAALMVAWTIAPDAQAQNQGKKAPSQMRGMEEERKRVEAKAAKEFQDLHAAFAGKPVTIFSKDTGPIEAVTIVKVLEFRGVGFLHLRGIKEGRNYLLRSENITLIRED